jgi:S1-C subfamily serine protease
VTSGIAALTAAAAVVAVAVASPGSTVSGTPSATGLSPNGGYPFPGSSGGGSLPQLPQLPQLPGSTGNGSGSGSSSGSSTKTQKASAEQQAGVVDIVSTLKYQSAEAAGTGIVLSSDGYVLTNNHVIDGSTSLRVTVVSTGKTYSATVVGTAPTKDVALIKLSGASGLTAADLGDSDGVKVGDKVTGVGNAGGQGGTPSAATGKVLALNQTITASDESGTDSEKLHGVIVVSAPIQAGDSGGPLYNADDQVVGVDTAANQSGTTTGFAIPIDDAVSIAQKIRSGVETSVIHQGYPGFLGVTVQASPVGGSGAFVSGLLGDGPAAQAGITQGSTITSVDGTRIGTAPKLHEVLTGLKPGSKVKVEWTDPFGSSHTATVTLATGPAD